MSPVTPPSSRVAHAPTAHATAAANRRERQPRQPGQGEGGRGREQQAGPRAPAIVTRERRAEPLAPRVREPLHDQHHRRAGQAGEQDQDARPVPARQRGERRQLDQQQADHADHGERAHVGIAQDRKAPLAVEAAEQGVAGVHEAVQVEGAGEGGQRGQQQGAVQKHRQVQRAQGQVEEGEHCPQQQADRREPGRGARERAGRIGRRGRVTR